MIRESLSVLILRMFFRSGKSKWYWTFSPAVNIYKLKQIKTYETNALGIEKVKGTKSLCRRKHTRIPLLSSLPGDKEEPSGPTELKT